VPRAARTWIAARDLDRVRRAIEALSERGRRFGTGRIELRDRLSGATGRSWWSFLESRPAPRAGRSSGDSTIETATQVGSASPTRALIVRPGPALAHGVSIAACCDARL
jgi:hypothetical protein